MNTNDLNEWQKGEIAKHENEVLSILQIAPQRFNRLKDLVNRGSRGLSITLKRLRKEQKIEVGMDDDENRIYKLTRKGKREFHDVFTLPFTLSWLEKQNGRMYPNYSGFHDDMWFCYLPWAIRDDLALSKEIDAKTNPISKEFVWELQRFILKRLR